MSYGGFYRKEDISFLKEKLMDNYRLSSFVGGRGTDGQYKLYSCRDGLLYKNVLNRPTDNFCAFSGRESIMSSAFGTELGFHSYWGMALI